MGIEKQKLASREFFNQLSLIIKYGRELMRGQLQASSWELVRVDDQML